MAEHVDDALAQPPLLHAAAKVKVIGVHQAASLHLNIVLWLGRAVRALHLQRVGGPGRHGALGESSAGAAAAAAAASPGVRCPGACAASLELGRVCEAGRGLLGCQQAAVRLAELRRSCASSGKAGVRCYRLGQCPMCGIPIQNAVWRARQHAAGVLSLSCPASALQAACALLHAPPARWQARCSRCESRTVTYVFGEAIDTEEEREAAVREASAWLHDAQKQLEDLGEAMHSRHCHLPPPPAACRLPQPTTTTTTTTSAKLCPTWPFLAVPNRLRGADRPPGDARSVGRRQRRGRRRDRCGTGAAVPGARHPLLEPGRHE